MIYKYCDIKGFDILLNSRLKIARLTEVNDPFEIPISLDEDVDSEKLKAVFAADPNYYRRLKTQYDEELNSCRSEDEFISFLRDERIKYLGKITADHRAEVIGKWGVICLSRRFDSVQMWTHYASNHTGIVVGIEETELPGVPESLITIDYDSPVIQLPPIYTEKEFEEKQDLIGELFLKSMRVKGRDWAYENEMRYYADLTDSQPQVVQYHPLKSAAIKELYLGWKAEDITKYIASSLKKDRFDHLNIFQMKVEARSFQLRADPVV